MEPDLPAMARGSLRAILGESRGAVERLLPVVMRARTPIAEVEAAHPERLAELYREFENGRARFLIAFRHPTINDPFSIGYLLARIVPRVARERSIALHNMTHTY